MTDSIELALEIRDKIAELPEAKEYLRLKNIIDSDEQIQNIQKHIVELQNNDKKQEAEKLLNELHSIPVVANFLDVKERLSALLNNIAQILN